MFIHLLVSPARLQLYIDVNSYDVPVTWTSKLRIRNQMCYLSVNTPAYNTKPRCGAQHLYRSESECAGEITKASVLKGGLIFLSIFCRNHQNLLEVSIVGMEIEIYCCCEVERRDIPHVYLNNSSRIQFQSPRKYISASSHSEKLIF